MAIIPTRWDVATLPYAYNTHISPDGLTYSSEDYYSNLAYSEFSATAGRWYWELRVDSLADDGHLRLGVARAETYDDVAAVATYAHPMSGGRPAVGDVLSVALDLDAGAMRITHNGTTWYETADIVASEGPWLAVVGNLGGTYPACVIAANFGAMPFAYPVPAGYAAGFGVQGEPTAGSADSVPSSLGAATQFGAPTAASVCWVASGIQLIPFIPPLIASQAASFGTAVAQQEQPIAAPVFGAPSVSFATSHPGISLEASVTFGVAVVRVVHEAASLEPVVFGDGDTPTYSTQVSSLFVQVEFGAPLARTVHPLGDWYAGIRMGPVGAAAFGRFPILDSIESTAFGAPYLGATIHRAMPLHAMPQFGPITISRSHVC